MNKAVFLDYNSTTPVDPEVLKEMLPWFSERFGNAASKIHSYGRQAADAVEKARKQVAEMAGCQPEEIYFTSGSTEGINFILKGIASAYKNKGNHIIALSTEHKAVLDTLKDLQEKGFNIDLIPVDRQGQADPDDIKKKIRPETILISSIWVNNETGTIQPMDNIGKIAMEHGIIFFSDATQVPGKLELNLNAGYISCASLSAHKLCGPKGIGAVYLRRKDPRVRPDPLIHGGGHERGMRSGTLNVPGIIGMGKAADLCNVMMWEDSVRISRLRTWLEQDIMEEGDIFINGSVKDRVFNTSNLLISGVKSSELITRCNSLAFSAGSACSSALPEPSHVLRAMGLTEKEAYSSIRLSLGRYTTEDEVQQASEILRKAIKSLR